MLCVCHVVASLHADAGGPSRTVVQLTDTLACREDMITLLVSQSRTVGGDVPSRNRAIAHYVEKNRSSIGSYLGTSGWRSLRRALATETVDCLHSNGVWHPLNHWCAVEARRRRIPLVVQPHGMLEPWALAWRSTKKRLALAAFQRRDLDNAALLVATARQEAEGFRQFGLRQPIAIIPNGIDMATRLNADQPAMAGNLFSLRRALFLSRIHPKKGLINLLDAWSSVDSRNWLLQLAGPDEGGHLAEVMAHAEAIGIKDQVQYLGSFDDAAKLQVYREADLFVLPSFSENFGVVVAEALAQRLPVITTYGTPWQDLQTYDCGWWVAPSVDGLRAALADALYASPQRLREMGVRGQAYVQRYDWERIAEQTLAAYRWLLGRGEKPDFIEP